MKKLILIPILLCAAATSGFAQSVIIPQVMAFQGYVTDADTAFTDTVGQTIVVVNLYDSAAGGNEVWSDTWDTVHVFRGYYTVTLDLSIAAGHWQGANSGFTKQYWLDAIVKGNHLTPKVQLTSAAYSFRAQVADSARAADTANVALNLVSGSPIGTIEAYGGDITQLLGPATGWMVCNGDSILISDYPNYNIYCGAIYGHSADQKWVYLPDLRGMFLRGASNGRPDSLIDPNISSRYAPKNGSLFAPDFVGSIQPDAFQGHYHDIGVAPNAGGLEAIQPLTNQVYGGPPFRALEFTADRASTPVTDSPDLVSVGPSGWPRTSSETRPKNAYVYWIIKVK